MEIIQNNPYRIAGILANASLKEVVKQKSKIPKFAEIGRHVDSKLDFPFMGTVDRTNINKVKQAFSGIQQSQGKVRYSLFWFLKANTFDETAINYMINGDKEKAIEIWNKVTSGKEVTSKNFSCFNNIGTLKLLSDSKEQIKEGLEAKIKLIESPIFADFVHAVADQTYTIDNKKQAEKFVDDVLKQFKGKYSITGTIKLFNNSNATIQKYLTQKFTEEPLYKIENQIESCKKKRKADKANAYGIGLRLFTNTKEDLTLLKSILDTSDLKYKVVADQLANEIMQCGIDYYNKSQENDSSENYLESAQKLTKLADSIAVGKLTKDRAKDSLAVLEEMKEREVNQAIAILNSIKSAYVKAISEIDAQVSASIMNMSYNQSINYSKVDKIKANCLNWNKVVEVVRNDISIIDVEAIQRCSNQSKVSEYKNLVDFLLGKLGPMQINQVKYLSYWKNVRTIQAKSSAKKIARTAVDTVSNTNDASNGCLGRIIGIAIVGFIYWLLSLIFS